MVRDACVSCIVAMHIADCWRWLLTVFSRRITAQKLENIQHGVEPGVERMNVYLFRNRRLEQEYYELYDEVHGADGQLIRPRVGAKRGANDSGELLETLKQWEKMRQERTSECAVFGWGRLQDVERVELLFRTCRCSQRREPLHFADHNELCLKLRTLLPINDTDR